jgi:hypothetical protein
MKTTTFHALARALAFLPLLAAGCGTEGAPVAPTGSDRSAQTSPGACAPGPDCSESLGDDAGPFVASITTSADADGVPRRRLVVTYREPIDSKILLCRLFPHQPAASLVFVVGPEGERASIMGSMDVSCPVGDPGGHPATATFRLVESERPELWDALFPPRPDGSRWYALQIALVNAVGEWDSNFGQNYGLVVDPA